jgi:hypothetical protein
LVTEMKERSMVTSDISSGRSSARNLRTLNPSRTTTRGSDCSFHASCPRRHQSVNWERHSEAGNR